MVKNEKDWHGLKVMNLKVLDKFFSNSLIIHQVKTKEITTVKEVYCLPGLKKHRL